MRKLLTTKTLLIGILVLASFLRLWQLGSVPPSPDWDEAALGYNAFSILETGKDEYGNFLPVVLRSFGDYKPALYAYLTIPFIKVLGLNVIAVRLPAALIGIVTVYLVYLLVRQLSSRRELALMAAFLLAVSPWHIQFSRVAFESGVGVTCNILMVLFFLKGLKNPRMMIFSAMSGGIALYVYQSEKVFTPLLLLLCVVIYFKKFIKLPRPALFWMVAAGCIVILPMVFYIFSHADSLSRATKTVSFADQKVFLRENSMRQLQDRENKDYIGRVLDDRRLVYAKALTASYVAHFDPNWLFLTGDANRHHAPGMGMLYLLELPFLLLGIYWLIFTSDVKKREKLLIAGWILLAPVPASLGSDVPHSVRVMNYLPMLQILIAGGLIYGYDVLVRTIKTKQYRYAVVGIVGLLFLWNFFYYLNQYFVQLNYFYSRDWQYGYSQLIKSLGPIQSEYKRIVISDKFPMDQSYIFILFYTQFPPEKFQAAMSSLEKRGVDHKEFGKYVIRPLNWERDQYTNEILYVGIPSEFPKGAKTRDTIRYMNGDEAILLVDPRKQ